MRCCAGRIGDYKSPESSLASSRLDIGDGQREDFRSIEIGGRSLSLRASCRPMALKEPIAPKEEPTAPKEERHSFMEKIMRGGSGCLRAESMVSTQVPHHALQPPLCEPQRKPSGDIRLQSLDESHGWTVARAVPW